MKSKDIGCVHIYCGDGKGKTSAALGLAVRALGRGKKGLIARFLKNDDSGEVAVLGTLANLSVKPCKKCFGFYSQMSERQKREAGEYYNSLFREAWEEAVENRLDFLILDEIIAACQYGLVEEAEVIRRLHMRPLALEVIMTGREPSAGLMEQADYVSEIRKVKHPYDRGLGAREGIEY